jgi:hypothetical protein
VACEMIYRGIYEFRPVFDSAGLMFS